MGAKTMIDKTVISYDQDSKKQVLWLNSLFDGMSDTRKCKILFSALSLMESYNGRGISRVIAETTFDYLSKKEKIQFMEHLKRKDNK
jgi:hypothetical protein